MRVENLKEIEKHEFIHRGGLILYDGRDEDYDRI